MHGQIVNDFSNKKELGLKHLLSARNSVLQAIIAGRSVSVLTPWKLAPPPPQESRQQPQLPGLRESGGAALPLCFSSKRFRNSLFYFSLMVMVLTRLFRAPDKQNEMESS